MKKKLHTADVEELRIANLSRGILLILHILKKEELEKWENFAGGFILKCIRELQGLKNKNKDNLINKSEVTQIFQHLTRKGVPALWGHKSWLIEPFLKSGRTARKALLSTLPLVFIRCAVQYMENNTCLLSEKLSDNRCSSPALSVWTAKYLPPAEDFAQTVEIDPNFFSNPLQILIKYPFSLKDLPLSEFNEINDILIKFENKITPLIARASIVTQDEKIIQLAKTIASVAASLSFIPPYATNLSLALPREVGKEFYNCSKIFSLLISEDIKESFYKEFKKYLNKAGFLLNLN